jgi:hypothetical protein
MREIGVLCYVVLLCEWRSEGLYIAIAGLFCCHACVCLVLTGHWSVGWLVGCLSDESFVGLCMGLCMGLCKLAEGLVCCLSVWLVMVGLIGMCLLFLFLFFYSCRGYLSMVFMNVS